MIDDDRANDYLFEILVAWHFFVKGCEIRWFDNNKKHSEFLIKDSDFTFSVECKRISVDIGRRIRRKDFYRLVDILFPKIRRLNYSGSIDIVLKDHLSSSNKFLESLSDQIIKEIGIGNKNNVPVPPFGILNYNFKKASGEVVDLNQYYQGLLLRKKVNTAVGLEKRQDGKMVDLIEVSISSDNPDAVLSRIQDRLERGGKDQLDITIPGLLCCYLSGVDDLRGLADDSGLQRMTCYLLAKDSFRHIAAISYASKNLTSRMENIETYFNQGLIFRNSKCKFEKAKDYGFLGKL